MRTRKLGCNRRSVVATLRRRASSFCSCSSVTPRVPYLNDRAPFHCSGIGFALFSITSSLAEHGLSRSPLAFRSFRWTLDGFGCWKRRWGGDVIWEVGKCGVVIRFCFRSECDLSAFGFCMFDEKRRDHHGRQYWRPRPVSLLWRQRSSRIYESLES